LEQAEIAAENASELFKEGRRCGLIRLCRSRVALSITFVLLVTSGIPIRVLVQGALDGVPAGHTYGLKEGVQQFKWCLVFFARMDRHM
jgi:hypothetical protein